MAIVEVEHLTKRYGQVEAVQGISFAIQPNQCVSLLGPNGAGKTTTLKMLAGLTQPTSGTIEFPTSNARDTRSFVGYLPQQFAFHEWMTGRDFLEYMARLARVKRTDVASRSQALLELVGLSQAADRKIGGYSGGMRQRLGIAQALIHDPPFLIMDEPVSALDPVGRREILDLIRQIRDHTTILYSTHVLHDAEEVSDAILIMVKGRIVVAGSFEDVRRQYQEPVIRIQAETSLEPWVAGVGRFASVDRVECAENHANIFTNDLDAARNDLLQFISQHAIPIQRIEVGQTSLEDLFMKVVKS